MEHMGVTEGVLHMFFKGPLRSTLYNALPICYDPFP